jgi:hypothetical protein
MSIQGSAVEIWTRAQWNLNARSMTASPPMLSASSIFLPPAHCPFIPAKERLGGRFKKFFHFLLFLKKVQA